MMASVTIAAATNLLRQAYGSYANDRTLVVPMENPSNFRLLTTPQLRKKLCTDRAPKSKAPRSAPKPRPEPRQRKTNLEKIIERRV